MTKKEKFYGAVGRRKNAIARVRLFKGEGIFINEKPLRDYFPTLELQNIAQESLVKKFRVSVKVKGGGIRGQAEAIRLGIARALRKYDEKLKPSLRAAGFLTRDSRMKERKKPGLKKARRAPQWSKR